MKQARRRRRAWLLLGGALLLGALVWRWGLPNGPLGRPVAFNPAWTPGVLAAAVPGWPKLAPMLKGPTTGVKATKLSLLATTALGGEWAVAYLLEGPADPGGARMVVPGVAILAPGEPGPDGQPKWALRLGTQRLGGWSEEGKLAFEGAEVAEAQLQVVPLGQGAHGLWWRSNLEALRGGHLASGQASLFARHQGAWTEVYQGPSENRWQAGFSDEAARTAELNMEDVDGDGVMELLRRESAYLRRLDHQGKGLHVSVEGLGAWVHHRAGGRYQLSALEAGGRSWRCRNAAPLVAVRAPEGAVKVDGAFGDWEGLEAANALALKLDSLKQLANKKRDRHGIEDFAAELALAYDAKALYLRAIVADDKSVPCPPGPKLYEGDHLVAWLDTQLNEDFDEEKSNEDDWGLGFGISAFPGPGIGHAWLPKAGQSGSSCAWAPLRDPNSGGHLGHQLEAAIPWAMLGISAPPLAGLPADAVGPPPPGQVKHLRLRAQAMYGIGLALSDADAGPQELTYASNPRLAWGKPTTLNPLVFAEAHIAPAPVVSAPEGGWLR